MSRFENQFNIIYYTMKKIVYVVISMAFLVVGCQKTEVINPQSGHSMSFSTEMGKLTKSVGIADAENAGIRNLEAQDFSVWAYADPDSDFQSLTNVSATGIYDGIENLWVECKTASVAAVPDDPNTDGDQSVAAVPGVWTTGKEYYWPGDSKALRFFAVSADASWLRPTGDDSTCPVTPDYRTPSMTIANFEVTSTANNDLMVADFVKQDQNKKQVDLTFRHTLAKVEFIFKTLAPEQGQTAPDVWVQSLSVAGMKYKGTLDVTPTDPAATSWTFTWDRDDATTTFNDDWNETAQYLPGSEAAVLEDVTAMKLTPSPETFTTWLMLPQPIDENSEVSIDYVINKRHFTAIFPLNGDANTEIDSWACNQHIRYTVVLAPNVISFKPSVDAWDQYDANPDNGNDAQGNNIYDDIQMQN